MPRSRHNTVHGLQTFFILPKANDPVSSIKYKLVCVYSKPSNQSVSAVWSFLVFHLKKCWTLGTHRDWSDTQADLSLRWAHMPTCNFCWTLAQIEFWPIWMLNGFIYEMCLPFTQSYDAFEISCIWKYYGKWSICANAPFSIIFSRVFKT